MTTTDTLKASVVEQIEQLRPILDGTRKPAGIRVAVWLNPDGRLREVETTPVFKTNGEKR